MSAIKPPGGPGTPGGIAPPTGTEGASGTQGPSFQDRVTENRGATTTTATTATAPSAATPQTVIADLRDGRISPNEAVQRLTDLAVERSGTPAAMRPAVEARLRDLLARDPLVQDLMRRMGATLASDK